MKQKSGTPSTTTVKALPSSIEKEKKEKSKLHIIILSSILLRILIGFHNHSGQNNNHNNDKSIAYGGDFEAQRHWMEITNHLTINKWYYYELQYWGLDYPILTAYHSYACGYLARMLMGEYCMELDTSRGIEDDALKVYMRCTVLVFDIMIYFSSIILLSRWIMKNNCDTIDSNYNNNQYLWLIVICLFQPSIILIDHGHFQYNTISLGLSCWCFYLLLKSSNCNKNNYHPSTIIMASTFYCLSLNFKQIALYYAPTIFVYLLGKCYTTTTTTSITKKKNKVIYNDYHFSWKKFFQLGITVLLTFGILWLPYFFYIRHQSSTTSSPSFSIKDEILHVLNRIFPFNRGLYESKVSNIWCVLSMKPIQIQKRISSSLIPTLALLLTLILLLPSCIILFLYSKYTSTSSSSTSSSRKKKQEEIQIFLWAISSCSLSFFLGSYQVHEKSILYAITPISLLFYYHPMFVICFYTTFSSWTLWPLLQIDELRIAYCACQLIFICLSFIYYCHFYLPHQQLQREQHDGNNLNDNNNECYYYYHKINSIIRFITNYIIIPLSWICMITLHILEIYVDAPKHLPDLFSVLWSIIGCFFFCYTWLYCTWNVIYLYLKSMIWRNGSCYEDNIVDKID